MEYNYELGTISAKLAISELSEAKPPLSGCYSSKYDVYFVLFDNWKLYAFMRSLFVLQEISFNSKYFIGLHFQSHSDSIIAVSADGMLSLIRNRLLLLHYQHEHQGDQVQVDDQVQHAQDQKGEFQGPLRVEQRLLSSLKKRQAQLGVRVELSGSPNSRRQQGCLSLPI